MSSTSFFLFFSFDEEPFPSLFELSRHEGGSGKKKGQSFFLSFFFPFSVCRTDSAATGKSPLRRGPPERSAATTEPPEPQPQERTRAPRRQRSRAASAAAAAMPSMTTTRCRCRCRCCRQSCVRFPPRPWLRPPRDRRPPRLGGEGHSTCLPKELHLTWRRGSWEREKQARLALFPFSAMM